MVSNILFFGPLWLTVLIEATNSIDSQEFMIENFDNSVVSNKNRATFSFDRSPPTDDSTHTVITDGRFGIDVTTNEMAFSSIGFNRSRPTIFIVHGFIDSSSTPWTRDMAQKLLALDEKPNVFIVDWNSMGFYSSIAKTCRWVAVNIYRFTSANHIRPSTIHVIGHSLGAHVAGFYGKIFPDRQYPNEKVRRITGLDPAWPGFRNFEIKHSLFSFPKIVNSPADPRDKLAKTDADFVDVIHTSSLYIPWEHGMWEGAHKFMVQGLGLDEPLGHIDFYPGGGRYQSGCEFTNDIGPLPKINKNNGMATRSLSYPINIFTKWTSMDYFIHHIMEFIADKIACNHMRSIYLFVESIDIHPDCKFTACEAHDYDRFKKDGCIHAVKNNLGFHAKMPTNESGGRYYLITNGKHHFCNDDYIKLPYIV